jgi:predicted Zn-dependent protease
MKRQPLQAVALLLTFLIMLPAPQFIAAAQDAAASTTQEKPKQESSEEKKLRQDEENRKKKEDKRQKDEEKARAVAMKTYKTLTEFAEDLYAGDREFKEQVDDGYSDLQALHSELAYRINISRRQEVLLTENEGERISLRRALYDNPRVQEYVNRLGQQIVPDDSDKLYAFKVVVNPIPYAYTLSTGTILISTGMISLLDNEAQLAYVLAHEVAHAYKDHWRIKVMMPLAEVEYNRKQAIKQLFWTTVLGLTAAGIGGAVAGKEGAGVGAVSGAMAGRALGNYYAARIGVDWNIAQENEADDFALKTILQKSFDIKEVPRLYATMAQMSGRDMRLQLGFLGASSRIRERIDHSQKLIDGSLQPQYQEALKANKIRGMGPEFNLIMAELKRDNGIEAFYRDMFQLAKMNLQQSVMLRSDDPLAAYYYGRVMKQVGRTKEELDLAQQSLLKAISLDTRHEIPEVQLHRALMLMDSKDSSTNPEAIAALKSYITAYGQKRATIIRNEQLVPPNIDILYGYMRLLGDKTWTVPDVVETLRASSATPNFPTSAPPTTIPRIEPASQTLSPTSKKTRSRP